MKNITSRADVFPFLRSFLDHLNRRTKIKLRCRCFVNFFCGDAVFVIFFCGVAVLTVPQCPPPYDVIVKSGFLFRSQQVSVLNSKIEQIGSKSKVKQKN